MMPALLLLALAQTYDPAQQGQAQHIRPRTFRSEGPARTSRLGQASYAFFEFAPADGAGMPAVCSTTAPTGAKGEALTFTRATTATCTKTASGGLATTGIADGDLVVLSSGQPRVMYDAAGVLGPAREEARTNVNVRSEEIDNAAYADTTAGGAAAPTLNGTCGTSPLAAAGSAPEDYTFPATTATQLSIRRATAAVGCSGAACTYSFYVKGVSGSGAMDVCAWDTSTPVCAACAFVDTSWTRCTLTSTRSGVVGLGIGNGSLYNGGTARSSNRVCVTGAQAEVGAYVTSYIPTTNAAVARNADQDPTFSGVSLAGLASSGSSAISVTPAATGSMAGGLIIMGSAGRPLYTVTTTARTYDGTNEVTTAHNFTAGTTKRYWTSWSGSTLTVTNSSDGNSNSGSFDGAMATTSLQIGASAGVIGLTASWIVTKACIDPSPTRCR